MVYKFDVSLYDELLLLNSQYSICFKELFLQ